MSVWKLAPRKFALSSQNAAETVRSACLVSAKAPPGVRKGEIVDFQNASNCVHDALSDAEERSDHEIKSVWLAVTGSHIESSNHRRSVTIEGGGEITEKEIEDIASKDKEVILPKDNDILHSILQQYYVDGREG